MHISLKKPARIPTVNQCFSLMEEYEMLDNIKKHSIVVARVSDFLVRNLIYNGYDLSVELTVSGALLHDIAKTESIKEGGNHSDMGSDICFSRNMPEVAEIVMQHILLDESSLEEISEKHIVYYADKRVLHDKVVNLDERLAYLIARYGNGIAALEEHIRSNFEICKIVEKKLFLDLSFAPEDLTTLMEHEKFESLPLGN